MGHLPLEVIMSAAEDDISLDDVVRMHAAGDVSRARDALARKVQAARANFQAAGKGLAELLLFQETADLDRDPSEDVQRRVPSDWPTTLSDEAVRIAEIAGLDPKTRIQVIVQASSRHSLRGEWAHSIALLRQALALAAPSELMVEAAWVRGMIVCELFASRDLAGALVEVESWSHWPLDPEDLWLVGEALFEAQRPECVPIFERLLRHRDDLKGNALEVLEGMMATARTWRRPG